MKTVKILLAALMLACSMQVQAKDDALRHTTDVLCLLPDATALGVAIAKHDTEGLKQLGLSTATCLAVNYGLELCIRKDRPDGTGHHAFPSTHTGAFPPISFQVLWLGGAFTPTATTGGTYWAVPPSEQGAPSSSPGRLWETLT